jgi:hypothetical protein
VLNQMTEGGGLNEALSRRYGVQGPPSQVLASEVFPYVCVSDDGMDPELHLLANSRLAMAQLGDGAGGGATDFSHVMLTNPVGSGVIAVVQDIFTDSGTNRWKLAVQETLSPADTTSAGILRDSRWGFFTRRATCNVENFTGVAIGLDAMLFQPDVRHVRIPIVLAPGSRVIVVPDTEQIAMVGAFVWRERKVGEWERGLPGG